MAANRLPQWFREVIDDDTPTDVPVGPGWWEDAVRPEVERRVRQLADAYAESLADPRADTEWDGPSWVEDDVATPPLHTAATTTLPTFDTAEVTFEGVLGSERETAEIDRRQLRDPEPEAAPLDHHPSHAAQLGWIAIGIVVGVVLALGFVALVSFYRT